MKALLAGILISALQATAANIYTFTVPGGVTVVSPAGSVTGWGYSIQNQSNTEWLVTTGLNAGTFLHATPQSIFDFPDVAPGASVTIPYDPVTPAGLYQIFWDQNVPAGFVNSGSFILSAQWWTGNPSNGGTLIGAAASTSVPYSASLTAVPEPGAAGLAALAVLGLMTAAGCRRARQRFRVAAV